MSLVLYSTRIQSSQQIRTGPGKLQEMEQAIAEILGVADTNGAGYGIQIKRAPFAIHESGFLTASGAGVSGLSQAVPGIGGTPKTEQGLRLLDTVGNTQGMICVNGDYLEIYKDAGVSPDWETTPSWGSPINRVNLTTGFWDVGGAVGKGCGLLTMSDSIPSGSATAITWDSEIFDTDDLFFGTGSEVVIPTDEDGIYILAGGVEFNGDLDGGDVVWARFLINSSYAAPLFMGTLAGPVSQPGGGGSMIWPLSEGDTAGIVVYHNYNPSVPTNRSVDAWLGVYKLGTE